MTMLQKCQISLVSLNSVITEKEKELSNNLKSMNASLYNLRNNGEFDPKSPILFGEISFMKGYMSKISELKDLLEHLYTQRRLLESIMKDN